jgi:glycerol kinase
MKARELGWLVRELHSLADELDERGAAPLVLVIDQGGHASRVMAFDLHGHQLAESFTPISTYRSAPDRVEHDATEIADSVRTSLDDIALTLGEDAGRVLAAGMATQRSSIVCWDKRTGKPLSPVLSWQDRRNAALIERLKPYAGQIRQTTGLVLSAHYGASKLRWCLDELDSVHKARESKRLCCGPLASYLLHSLLDERPHLADPANASRTQLWDPRKRVWSQTLAAMFEVPLDLLPTCVPTRHGYGHLLFAGRKVPLVICTGDQSAAPFAFGRFDEDTLYLNMGTGAFLQRMSADDDIRLLRSVTYSDQDAFISVQEGTVNGAASALDWLNERVGIDTHRAAAALTREQKMEAPLFINAVGGVGSPYWRADLESRFIGSGSELAQVQAVVESIAFLITRNAELMGARNPPRKLLASGGLAASDYLCQCVASLVRLPVERSNLREATALGLAFLVADQPAQWQPGFHFETYTPEPNPTLRCRYERWCEEMAR